MTEIINDAEVLASEAKKPGVFNILNVLRDRGLPKDVVSIIIDDAKAYDAAKIKERIEELMSSDDDDINDEVEKLESDLSKITEELNSNRYAVHITGISEGKRDQLLKDALEKYPQEFDEQKHPFTGETTKIEIDSPEREEFFTDNLWVSSIENIVAPDGSEQSALDYNTVRQFRSLLSVVSNAAITQAIEKLRVSTAIFVMSADEDFLAKS